MGFAAAIPADAARHLRTGLGYTGPVEVSEYPRNARLAKGLERPIPIKERLGLRPEEAAVLYVPTWRDHHRNGRVDDWERFLDIERFTESVNARVLIRSHHMARLRGVEALNAIDVSSEPHVEDLMAVSDILVTDYSSIAEDFRMTGRPVVRFTPDFALYQQERGFYGADGAHSDGKEPLSTNNVVAVCDTIDELIAVVEAALNGECPDIEPDRDRVACQTRNQALANMLNSLNY